MPHFRTASILSRYAFARSSRFVAVRGGSFLALLLPIVFNPYTRAPFEPAKVTFFCWTVGATIILFFLHVILTKADGGRSIVLPACSSERLLVVCILAYGTVQVLATILSVDPYQSLWGGTTNHGTLTTLMLIAFCFIARWSSYVEDEGEMIRTGLILGSVPVITYAFVQLVGLDPLAWTTDAVSPVHSTLGRSNFLGAYLAMVIPFVLARILCEREAFQRGEPAFARIVPVVVLALLQMTTLLATQARAAWLAVMAAIAIFAAAQAWSRRRRMYLWLCAGALVLGIGFLPILNRVDLLRETGFVPKNQGEEAQPFASMRAHTIESRFRTWEAVLGLVSERWLLGFGPETFPKVFAKRHPSIAFPAHGNLRLTDPHNIFLSHLFDAGVLGLGTFVGLVAAFFAVAIGRMRSPCTAEQAVTSAAALAAVVAYLVHSQFSPDVIVLSFLFWTMMAIGPISRSTERSSTRFRSGKFLDGPKLA